LRFLADLAELVMPTRCAGCDLPGNLLCEECLALAMRHPPSESCPRCAAPFGALVCTECWERSFAFEAAVALGDLSAPLHRAVLLYKDASERRLGSLLGALLGEVVSDRWPDWADAVAWIPPSRQALARRGFDHAGEIASGVSGALGIDCRPLLTKARAADQRLLGRVARAENTVGTFTTVADVPPRVLLVDDVMTTGATLDSAAEELLDAGATNVRVAVVARAW
jgi:predicted amidophosphoribosyltransferase